MEKEELLSAINNTRKMEFQARVDDLKALKEAFGEQVTSIILSERGKKVETQWAQIAQEVGRNDIQALKDTLWKWVQEVGFEFTSEDTPEGTQFTVTRCPIADMAREINEADWGYTCYCADDPHIVAGFNQEIGFKRTKTLMEGDDCCNHFYYINQK